MGESAIGTEVVTMEHGPNALFRSYFVERPAHTRQLRAAEAVLEVTVKVPHPARQVWPIFTNPNLWMKRFGYVWDSLPVDNENNYVYLGNTGAANDLSYGTGDHKTRYVVRKVIPEQLIYLESLPLAVVGKDCVWSGHNLLTLSAEEGMTKVCSFMEHTWYSETIGIDELRAEARSVMFGSAVGFWRDYFIPDFLALFEPATVSR